jgi:hypothetical protein
MLDFLRRIPQLLGLGRKTKPQSPPPRLRVVGASESAGSKPLRGRGTGRGVTPPTHPKPKKRRQGKR